MLEWALLAALLAAAAWVLRSELFAPRGSGPAPMARAITITATILPGSAVVLNGTRLAGALALSSRDADFGGLSGLAALPGGRLAAVTDRGGWLVLRPVLAAGQLVGVADASIGSLAAAGTAAAGAEKYEMDAEAVAITPAGNLLISFEQQHRIGQYEGVPPRRLMGTSWHSQAMHWQSNGGGEALALWPDGAVLWLPEWPEAGVHHAVFSAAGARSRSVRVRGLSGFAITDAAVLDGNRVLLLHRRYTGVETAAALSVIDAGGLRAGGVTAGAMMTARLLLRWDRASAWPVDNMEGAALVRESGRLILYLVSDDNFSSTQRSLLLRLELPAGLVAGPGAAPTIAAPAKNRPEATPRPL